MEIGAYLTFQIIFCFVRNWRPINFLPPALSGKTQCYACAQPAIRANPSAGGFTFIPAEFLRDLMRARLAVIAFGLLFAVNQMRIVTDNIAFLTTSDNKSHATLLME